jgi:hypothetical protein
LNEIARIAHPRRQETTLIREQAAHYAQDSGRDSGSIVHFTTASGFKSGSALLDHLWRSRNLQRACIDALDQGFSPAGIHLLKFNLITSSTPRTASPSGDVLDSRSPDHELLGQLQRNPSFVLGKKPIAYFHTIPSPRIIDESVRLIFSWERLRTRTECSERSRRGSIGGLAQLTVPTKKLGMDGFCRRIVRARL